MLRGEPQMRPNLREIVLSLSSPKKTVFISRSMINKTEENQLMNQVYFRNDFIITQSKYIGFTSTG